jgi:FMN phosphatase YigB (HAD superfamily)
MPAIEHIFLDDGGVINDNTRRAPQWRRLVGEFFAPRLGGSESDWAAANESEFPGIFERFIARIAAWDDSTSDYKQEIEINNIDWLRSMCGAMRIEAPPDDPSCLALAQEATGYIMRRVRADFPGAIETVRWLADRFPVRTASNGASFELLQIYEPLGVESCFQTLYGPDLVGQPKTGRRFYDRIFEHAGVDPVTALVLDDNPNCVAWAREAGARALLAGDADDPDGLKSISALRDLPALLVRGP